MPCGRRIAPPVGFWKIPPLHTTIECRRPFVAGCDPQRSVWVVIGRTSPTLFSARECSPCLLSHHSSEEHVVAEGTGSQSHHRLLVVLYDRPGSQPGATLLFQCDWTIPCLCRSACFSNVIELSLRIFFILRRGSPCSSLLFFLYLWFFCFFHFSVLFFLCTFFCFVFFVSRAPPSFLYLLLYHHLRYWIKLLVDEISSKVGHCIAFFLFVLALSLLL